MSQGGWAQITGRLAVTVDGESLDIAELIELGGITGEWPAFEQRVALGLALERDHPDAVSEDDVRREATAFRYAHGLISAADFRSWLEARELTVRELSGALRRRLLRQQGLEPAGGPVSDEAVVTALPVEAFCDGVLVRLAERGVDCLAAGRLSPAEDREPESRLLSLERALERLRRDVAEPAAVAARVRQHALEWTELAGDELCFTGEGAAREARLQIAVDGHSAMAVAERAEVAVRDRRVLVGEAPATVGVSLAVATAGEVVGPWEEDGSWHVMQVRAKVAPSPENRLLGERARDELLRERIARYAAGRTTRHEPL
jgi:hypothetical protein